MVTSDHFAISGGLGCFDGGPTYKVVCGADLETVLGEEEEVKYGRHVARGGSTYWLLDIPKLSYFKILKGNDTSWLLVL